MRLAEEMARIPRFSRKKFESGLSEVRDLCKSSQSVKFIPDALRKLGVAFLVVEHLPRTKIDGATFWLSRTRPVVVLSLRYGRIDYFVFTLMHELMHVRHGDAQSFDNDILNDGKEAALPEIEIRANKEAGELLVPPKELAHFLASGRINKSEIVAFASTIGAHPGVVLGQLQHRGVVGWSACRDLLEPVRDIIVENATTDGWDKESSR